MSDVTCHMSLTPTATALLFQVILQIVIKKLILWPLEWQHKFDFLGVFMVFFLPKMRRKWDNISLYCQQKKYIYKNIYLLIFYTKMTIFPRKVRHVLARRDVCFCLTAKYLHIDIIDQNLKKVWIFSVLLFCVLVKCSPLFGEHRLQRAGRGSRRFRAPRRTSHKRETEQQTFVRIFFFLLV